MSAHDKKIVAETTENKLFVNEPTAVEGPDPTPKQLVEAAKAANDGAALDRLGKIFHEAAHAVVTHNVGGTVDWVNIDGDPQKKTQGKINLQKFFKILVDNLDAGRISSKEAFDALERIVASYAAGHLIEKEVNPAVEAISERIKDDTWFIPLPKIEADRDMIISVMRQIGVINIDFVKQAEVLARKIVDGKPVSFDALVGELHKTGYVEGNELQHILNK